MCLTERTFFPTLISFCLPWTGSQRLERTIHHRKVITIVWKQRFRNAKRHAYKRPSWTSSMKTKACDSKDILIKVLLFQDLWREQKRTKNERTSQPIFVRNQDTVKKREGHHKWMLEPEHKRCMEERSCRQTQDSTALCSGNLDLFLSCSTDLWTDGSSRMNASFISNGQNNRLWTVPLGLISVLSGSDPSYSRPWTRSIIRFPWQEEWNGMKKN